jgi:F-type H+-transporting ATPase subunit alpha
MAIRSDEIVSIIKNTIEHFDTSAESRSVGTVVQVGDGIAQIYGLSGALSRSCSSSRAASWAWP